MSQITQDRNGTGYHSHHDRHRDTRPNTTNNPFFIKSYICFGDLRHEPVNNITLTSFGNNPMVFSGNVWVTEVKNKKYWKFSRNASVCRVEINRFKNGTDVDEAVSLPWRSDPIPTRCNYPGSFQNIDGYRAKLPFCYIGSLTHELASPIIPVGGKRDIILACSFSGLDLLYIVSQKTMGEDDVISIPFNELGNYEFLIKFYSSQVTHEKKFKLNATSWNDVKLTWI
jgi:hypothetical protein